jgi:hypothetical protein
VSEGLTYFFSGLAQTEFTPRQERIMSAVFALMLKVKDASLQTCLDVLKDPHQKRFEEVFDQLPKPVADFWRGYNPKATRKNL